MRLALMFRLPALAERLEPAWPQSPAAGGPFDFKRDNALVVTLKGMPYVMHDR
jgi:hypothetical protein